MSQTSVPSSAACSILNMILYNHILTKSVNRYLLVNFYLKFY